jgi:hypothetical protein
MGADKNSSRRRCFLQKDEHNKPKNFSDSNYPVCQDHVAIENSGTNNHQTYSRTQWKKDLFSSHTTPIRPVMHIGQTGPSRVTRTEQLDHPTPNRDTPGHPEPLARSPKQNLRLSTKKPHIGQIGIAHQSGRSWLEIPKSKNSRLQAPNSTRHETIASLETN